MSMFLLKVALFSKPLQKKFDKKKDSEVSGHFLTEGKFFEKLMDRTTGVITRSEKKFC